MRRRGKRRRMEAEKMSNMPYERFVRFGAENLTEAELLAIILRTGTKKVTALELGKQILEQIGGLSGLYHVGLNSLQAINGIGEVKAVKIKCIAELSKRMAKECAKERLCFNSPGTIAMYYMEELRHEKKEKVLLLLLDTKGRLIKELILSTGTVNSSLISPREVFVEALRVETVGMIILHNHPSGNPAPSKTDEEITERIAEGAKIIDLVLIDHIIIGDNKYISFKEIGLL